MDNKSMIIRITIFSLLIVGAIVGMSMMATGSKTSTKYVSFAQCLTSKGVKFYGAFWCPHCQAQEAAFEMTREKLTEIGLYQECSNADGTQTAICISKNIQSYPTWDFASSTRISGFEDGQGAARMKELSDKSGCSLPVEESKK